MNLNGTWILTYIVQGTVVGAGVLSIAEGSFVGGDSSALITGSMSEANDNIDASFTLTQHTHQPWSNLLIPEGTYTIHGKHVNGELEFSVTPALKVSFRRP